MNAASVVTSVSIVRPGPGERTTAAAFSPRTRSSILVRWSTDGTPAVTLLGPLTVSRRKTFTTPRLVVQLLLRHGTARRVFGVPVAELTDRVVSAGELWGGRGTELLDALTGVDAESAVRAVRSTLDRADAGAGSTDPRVEAAAALLVTGATVATAARTVGISERHLSRLFAAEIGTSPRQFARIERVHRALRLARGATPWAQHALACGYCDQSHMIREFRSLLQRTPGEHATQRHHDAAWASAFEAAV